MRRELLPLLTLLLLAGLPAAAQTPDPADPPAPILEEEVTDQTPPPLDPAAEAAPPAATVDPGVFAPDRPEAGSVEQIRRFTTAPEYLPESVSYVPDSDTVPSPAEVLGHQVGAPGELSRVADVHGYFRKLDAASDRVMVRVVGTSEEGREILLAVLSDPANLANLERLQEINARLSDPRRTTREEARALAAEGKAVYYLTGGLHSAETGSPEMLMELAYRLAVSERPEIREIRENAVVLITPVLEPDGRDKQVDWFYRHLKGRDLSWEEVSEIDSPPYWGRYAYHDNNRDGMQQALALSHAVSDVFWAFRPQVMHDLHESLPLLYIMTGHGPYNRAIDPVTINEWTQLAHHEAGALQAAGLPGVWTWAFFDGWWPGYMNSIANTHHAVGRFYETFGNSSAETFERRLDRVKFLGKPVTEVQWYRPWPPGKTVRWSLRNNTNYMQAGVLEGLSYAARHREELLGNVWAKAHRSLEKGRSEAPYAWVFPPAQRDPARLAHLVERLRSHRIEVHRLSASARLGGASVPEGSIVVRMDQPYRNAAVTFLEEQEFPEDEPNPPYDDVAWTWPLLFGVEGRRIDDRAVLSAPMTPVGENPAPAGRVDGEGDIFLLRDTGQTALLTARVLLGAHQVDAAEVAFEARGVQYPPGSWIVQAPAEAVREVAAKTGLDFAATLTLPDVRRHVVDLPRLGLLHTWTDTQDAGWARYALDRAGFPYTLVSPDEARRGGLAERFDVLLFPEARGSLTTFLHGIDSRYGPLAFTRTDEFPSHGAPNGSPDITGGFSFEGMLALQAFLRDGGVLVAVGNSGRLAVDGGLVRPVSEADDGGNNPGSELRAKVLRPEHPLVYGYEENTSVFRGNGPLWDVADRDRGLAVLQFGTKQVPEEDTAAGRKAGTASESGEIEVEDFEAGTAEFAGTKAADAEEKGEPLVLSGFVKGTEEIDGKPALLDLPAGKGRVILFGFNPLHRYLNLSDFRFAWNALLHWNDLPR
jgi:hypothetical protein